MARNLALESYSLPIDDAPAYVMAHDERMTSKYPEFGMTLVCSPCYPAVDPNMVRDHAISKGYTEAWITTEKPERIPGEVAISVRGWALSVQMQAPPCAFMVAGNGQLIPWVSDDDEADDDPLPDLLPLDDPAWTADELTFMHAARDAYDERGIEDRESGVDLNRLAFLRWMVQTGRLDP